MLRGLLSAIFALALLAGCDGAQTTATATRAPLPAMKTFAPSPPAPPARPNGQIASDFLDLAFALESGRALSVFTRFEGPVTIRLTGRAPARLSADLDALITRLRREAGLEIARVAADHAASITVEVVASKNLKALLPGAACFVVPNVDSWQAYRAHRADARTDWAGLRTRSQMAVFLPDGTSGQEMRDCLHEEVAQALGPLNDLYRLPDSVFNDDNFHAVLTGFDMLILRAFYAPELHSGMTRDQIAARLPLVLERLNPSGGSALPRPAAPTPEGWKRAVETALSPAAGKPARRAAARRAVDIARAQGWREERMGFSLYILGRLSRGLPGGGALAAFEEARDIFASMPTAAVQSAHVALQLAAQQLSAGDGAGALALVDEALPAATAGQNAGLLAALLMVKAEALALLGRGGEAGRVRLDSLGWARYGFGSDEEVGRQLDEIAALAPDGKG